MALHAKAKAEAEYRFYALYDKIYREDVLAHAYAQCRSNRGAPGVDRQDFAEVEEYGVQKWLGELALALRQESYQPDPIRRVFVWSNFLGQVDRRTIRYRRGRKIDDKKAPTI
ncbi:hypothetical protein [Cupriavidus necator]|uniref:hypothetical protein n=1 Tax=Cupriavidus necator TaxID=106590 RepID=UPI001E31DF59|nr:hypothetical protein [Cupriavidus necator]